MQVLSCWVEERLGLRGSLDAAGDLFSNARPPFGTVPKQPNPSRIQAQPVQKPAPEKLPNVAFWRPQERWRKANANAWHHQTGSFESMKKPCKNHVVDGAVDGAAMAASVAAPASVRHGAETAQTPAGFKPNLSKNQPPKNCLTSPSDAHKKDEERPTPQRQCLTSPDRQLRKHEKNYAKTM